MQPITALGFVAGTLTILSFLPQVHKAWRTRRCDDLSMGLLLTFGSGVLLWIIYGLYLRAPPVVVANVGTIALIFTLIALKLRYGVRGERSAAAISHQERSRSA
jgi:MtN3 and saliva related transmembrane protein